MPDYSAWEDADIAYFLMSGINTVCKVTQIFQYLYMIFYTFANKFQA